MEVIEEMKSRVSMRELLESYGIYPVRGNNIYRCFVHSPDKKPSANIIKGKEIFHCLSRETKILTKNGLIEIGDLKDKKVEILNGNKEWEQVTIKSYGVQPLYEITLCRGGNKTGKFIKKIYATEKHRWFIDCRNSNKRIEKLTIDLEKRDRLSTNLTKCPDIEFDIDGIRHGFVFGDGFKNINKKKNVARAVFYTKEKENLMQYFENVHLGVHPTGKTFYEAKYVSDRDLTQIPTLNDSSNYILGFLAGYFSADGSFGKGVCKLSSSKKEDLIKVRDLCISQGIVCKNISGRYRLGINNKYSWIYTLSVLASSLPKGFDLTKRLKPKRINRECIHWAVMDVKRTDRVEEVYCCETSTTSFTLEDNILTGNCFSCNCSLDIFDVVQYFDKCDFKKSLRIIDDKFGLGLLRQLTHKEKLELARQRKLREKQRAEKEWWHKYENSVCAEIIKWLRFWEQVETETHITRGEYRNGTWSEERSTLFFTALKRQRWLNWLYDAICGFDHPECEFDYVYGTSKQELLEKIKKGEIDIW